MDKRHGIDKNGRAGRIPRLNAVSSIVIAADDNDVGIPTRVTNDGRKWVYHIEWAGDGRHGCDTNENCTYTKTELDEWAKQMGKKIKTKPNCINCTVNYVMDNRDRIATPTDKSYTKRKTAQEKIITQSKHKTKNTAVSPQTAWEEVKRQGELTIYSDGSVKNAGNVGTYAWMAGYHDQTGKFNSIIVGGGKEYIAANPMRGAINSTRMESYSRLREKTAKELRNTIMDGQHDIWKIRNQVKHGTTENGKIARDTSPAPSQVRGRDHHMEAGKLQPELPLPSPGTGHTNAPKHAIPHHSSHHTPGT